VKGEVSLAVCRELAVLKLLVVTIPLFSAPSTDQWPTFALGRSYALEEYGCQRREDSLIVARTFEGKGAREAWKLIMEKRRSRNGRPVCSKIGGEFVFTSLPVFETEINVRTGELQRLSVVHAQAGGKSHWLLMRNSLFAAN
jgi:hypothetical protein